MRATQRPLSLVVLAWGSQNPENVVLLIQLLELTDFYVRYHTINLLKLLGENQPKMLQASILESRVGVSRLVDLLDDQRELVRNGAHRCTGIYVDKAEPK